MPTTDQRYDATTRTLWLYRAYEDPFTLVPNEEIMRLSAALRDGSLDGQPLERVAYIFGHEDTAEYNHHALGFARLETFLGTLDAPTPYDTEDTASFGTREDFDVNF